jgi:hypothetical protein
MEKTREENKTWQQGKQYRPKVEEDRGKNHGIMETTL